MSGGDVFWERVATLFVEHNTDTAGSVGLVPFLKHMTFVCRARGLILTRLPLCTIHDK